MPTEPARQYPVGYAMGSTMEMQAMFSLGGFGGTWGGDGEICVCASTAAGSQLMRTDWTPVSVKGGWAYVDVETNEAFQSVADYNSMSITWYATVVNPGDTTIGTNNVVVGTSSDRVYVTYKAPLHGGAYETCVMLGCDAAEDFTSTYTTQQVADSVYGGFESRNVHRLDGVQMVYSHDGVLHTDYGSSAAEMLANPLGKGQCTAWADLLVQTFAAQGISATSDRINSVAPYRGFSVELLPAQGTGIDGYPTGVFPDYFKFHQVVRLGNTIYDPSYGTSPVWGADWAAAERKYQDETITHLYDTTWVGVDQIGLVELRSLASGLYIHITP